MRIAALILVLGGAAAIPAPFVPDDELAKRPVIVVAKWKDAPFRPHHKVEGEVLKEWELRTDIEVERVIQGDLKPGRHAVQLGFRIGWREEGGPVVSFMSTEQIGDVHEVGQPNLWLLSRKRSWDPLDATEYLCLDTFRGVQPLVLEKYFDALRSKDPKSEVPKLAEADDALVVGRVLEYIAGGRMPWPYEPWDFVRPERTKKAPLKAEAGRVAKLLHPLKSSEIRGRALAVYAELAGAEALPRIRELLADEDRLVRAIAAGLAAGQRDVGSIEALEKAGASFAEPSRTERWRKEDRIACDFAARCAEWGDVRLVPALIPFLENDTFVYRYGDDLGIPALKAREALRKLTGREFPTDVAAGRKVWEQIRGIGDPEERGRKLAELLGSAPERLTAQAVLEDGKLSFLLKNTSALPVWVAKQPESVTLEYSNGTGSFGAEEPKGKDDFQELAPGKQVRVAFERDADFLKGFLAAEPASRRILLTYHRNGREFGLNAWIGSLVVKFGEAWKELPRDVKIVEEKWPDGTLKARGPTLNGKRHGTWRFFREDGKPIRETHYFDGNPGGGAELNPDAFPAEGRRK